MDKHPIIQQLHDADCDRARADILLRCPDGVILKYAEVFINACQAFAAGQMFVIKRVAAMSSSRDAAGLLPERMAVELDQFRSELAAFAAGAPVAGSNADPPPSPTDL